MRPNSKLFSMARPPARHFVALASSSIALLVLLTGCARPLVLDGNLTQQFEKVGCIESCRLDKESCNADARYDYRQCQAGYGKSVRNYQWCRASARSEGECGYPWWSCAENLYGYCANRHSECVRACESRR